MDRYSGKKIKKKRRNQATHILKYSPWIVKLWSLSVWSVSYVELSPIKVFALVSQFDFGAQKFERSDTKWKSDKGGQPEHQSENSEQL